MDKDDFCLYLSELNTSDTFISNKVSLKETAVLVVIILWNFVYNICCRTVALLAIFNQPSLVY